MRVFLLSLLLAFSSLLTAQCGNRYNTAIFVNVDVATYQFGENTRYNGVNQKLNLDLYTPKGDIVMNRPCVVFCFGGAFVSGTRSSPELSYFANSLAQRGFVCASIDYRLDNTTNMTTNGENGSVIRAVQDAKAAIRFLKSKSSEFGIDSNMVFIGGTSAGGVTALTLGYSQYDELKDSIKNSINSLGGWEGTTNNIAQTSLIKGVFNFSGAILDINHISNNDLPVYLNHANKDEVVPFRSGYPLNGQSSTFMHGSYNIAQRMREKGNYYILDSFNTSDHPAFTSSNFVQALSDLNLTAENLIKFLYKVMKCDQGASGVSGLQTHKIYFENPVRHFLNLPEGINANEIEMYNLLGKKVRLKYDNSKQIDISHISRGIYLIKHKESVQKIILE